MSNNDVVSHKVTKAKAVSSYWTQDRMASARPIEVPGIAGSVRDLASGAETVEEWVQSEPPVIVESVAPDNAHPDYGTEEDAIEGVRAAGHTTTQVPRRNYTKHPWQTVGKLFMTFGSSDYVGSAWVLSGTQSAIFTAGHCVFDQGKWAKNVMFLPQYYNGASAGTWAMKQLWSLNGWTNDRDFQYDLSTCLATQPIAPTTGTAGWMANYPPNQGPYTGIGYPASAIPGYNFNGKSMWQSAGSYINGKDIIQAYNNMTGGCSGGPWRVSMNGVPYMNGINSHRYKSNPSTMYSPYFGEGFLNLYAEVKGK